MEDVRESMDLANINPIAVDGSRDDAPVRGTEIDRCEDPRGNGQRKKAAATPASTGTSSPVV
jgi:hypothetical protein